jgi:hypothetical protein
MQSCVVVWSGEIEKRMRDQQIRPAPPDETQEERDARLAKAEALRSRFACVELVRGAVTSTLTEITPKGAVIFR